MFCWERGGCTCGLTLSLALREIDLLIPGLTWGDHFGFLSAEVSYLRQDSKNQQKKVGIDDFKEIILK